ncbi:hypothetical protein HY213_05545, partial [Candidatus Peregrinibacteria bacterium]|nr:hypothetical protein [Candidatus Peregrinibacteria bacterium]
MQHSPLTQTVRSDWQTIVLGIAVAGVIALFGVLVFIRSRDVMREELQQRLRSTAAAAAMQFDGAWLEGIATRADMRKPMFTMLVSRLREIRDRVPNIRYAYIMRQTKDRNAVAFVADANSLTS